MPREVKWAISFLVGAGLLWFGWRFYIVLVILHILVCLVLMGVILLQSGEAADLAGAFGGAGSQTAFGPRGAATFLSKATTWCAIMFMMTSMAMTMHQNATGAGPGSSVLQQFSKTKNAAPAVPIPAGSAPATPAPGGATPAPSAPPPATPAPSK